MLTHSLLDVAGVALFAASGALAAAQRRPTILAMLSIATVTGLAGGAARDLLMGAPVFSLHDPRPLLACLVVAALLWVTRGRDWHPRASYWFDAAAMALYSVYGAAKALEFGVGPVPAAVIGVAAGCAGGILRDLLLGAPSILRRPELYVTASALAATTFLIAVDFGLAPLPAAGLAMLPGFGLRALVIAKGLEMPVYRS
jgi:uncharacterized membrane protein YeiH